MEIHCSNLKEIDVVTFYSLPVKIKKEKVKRKTKMKNKTYFIHYV